MQCNEAQSVFKKSISDSLMKTLSTNSYEKSKQSLVIFAFQLGVSGLKLGWAHHSEATVSFLTIRQPATIHG